MNQNLTCTNCQKPWTRNAQRGRKPKLCPTCQNPKAAKVEKSSETETLICKNGNHEFDRIRTRGKKPSLCPEHRITKTTQTDEGEEKTVNVPSVKVRTPAIQAILDGDQTELRRKVEYVVNEFESPNNREDWGGLITTHKGLVREAERSLSLVPTTSIEV
jgi:hypothetical protein